MKKSIKCNYFFNIAYQLLVIIVPLITTPYVSRIIGAEGIGAISYTNSIISYLILMGSLGMGAYSSRQIAYYQFDKEKQSEIFSELFSVKLLLMLPAFSLLMVIAMLSDAYRILYFIQIGYLISDAITIDWLYTGNEDFEVTITRSFIIKLISVFLIFILVKDAGDLYIYAGILTGAYLLSGISLWIGCKRYVSNIKFSLKNMRKHLQGALAIFSVQIASSMYLYLDKTMIGLLADSIAENGYYEQTQKIVRLSITIITSLSTVMLPRIANAYKENNTEAIRVYMENSLKFAFFMGIPMTFGLIGCSDNIVPWFLGAEFDECRLLLKIFAPVILFNSIYNVIGYQYLLAIKEEKKVTMIVSVGACCNFALNLIMIPYMRATGAALASLCAEMVVALLMILYIRRNMQFDNMKKYILKCLIAATIMYVLIVVLEGMVEPGFGQTLFLLIVGIVCYFFFMTILRENYILGMVRGMVLKLHERIRNGR